MRLHAKAVLVIAAAVGVAPAIAAAATDEQAQADAVIDAFESRMADAGWVSTGAPSDDDEDDEEADEEFDECVAQFAGLEGIDEDEFEGTVADAESDEFTFTPESEGVATTGVFEIPQEETVAAGVLIFDEEHAKVAVEFIEVLGSDEFTECFSEALTAAAEDEEFAGAEFEVDNQADLGIGDQSARLNFSFDVSVFGVSFEGTFALLFARVDRTMVAVIHASTGVPTSGLDPEEELQFLVDSLAG